MPCTSPNGGLIVLYFFVGFVYVYVQHFLAQSESASARTKIFMFFVQTCILLLGDFDDWILFLQPAFSGDTAGFGDWCMIPLDQYQKAVFNTLRPAFLIIQLGIQAIVHWLYGTFFRSIIFKKTRGEMFVFPKSAYVRSLCALLIYSYTVRSLAGLKCSLTSAGCV